MAMTLDEQQQSRGHDTASADLSASDGSELRARPSEVLVPGGLGVVLWAVICWTPLEIELSAASPRMSVALLFMVPLAALALSLFLRRAVLCMVALPLSLTACFTVLEPLDLRVLGTLQGGLTLGGALLLFLLGTSVWGPQRERRPRVRSERLRAGVDPSHRRTMGFVLPRLALLVALFVVPLWALYGADGQALLAESFADRRLEAQVLVHTVHLFIAVLATYLFFLSPAINQPLEQAELRERLARMPQRTELSRYRRNLVLWLAVGLVAGAAFFWLRL